MTPNDAHGKRYPRGTYSKIARRLGVTPQTVRLVALEIMTSARVSAELRKELRNVKRREARSERKKIAADQAA